MKRLITMILICVFILSISSTLAFADGGKDDGSGAGSNDVIPKVIVNDDNVELSAGNTENLSDPNSNTTGNNNPSPSSEQSTTPGAEGKDGTPDTIKQVPGDPIKTPEVIIPPTKEIDPWEITVGWTWDIDEWKNREDWFWAQEKIKNPGTPGKPGDVKPGTILELLKTIFLGGKPPIDGTKDIFDESCMVKEKSVITETNELRNRTVLHYDWTITNLTDKGIPVGRATTGSMYLKYYFNVTGKYYAIAKPWVQERFKEKGKSIKKIHYGVEFDYKT